MRYLLLFVVAVFSASAQTGNGGSNTAPPPGSSSIPAELSKRIDSKNAHVGDPVLAKLTSTVTFADGTVFPKNTKLIGKVTEVRAKSKEDKSASVAFSLDHAVLKDGRQISIHAMLTSLSAPSNYMGGSGMNDLGASPGMGAGAARAGGSAGAGGRTSESTPNTVSPAEATPDSTNGVLQTNPPPGGPPIMPPEDNAKLNTAQRLDNVPVANLPGVTFSSAENASDTAALSAKDRNVDLEGGAKMTLRLAVSSAAPASH